jgi:hypothetical protein
MMLSGRLVTTVRLPPSHQRLTLLPLPVLQLQPSSLLLLNRPTARPTLLLTYLRCTSLTPLRARAPQMRSNQPPPHLACRHARPAALLQPAQLPQPLPPLSLSAGSCRTLSGQRLRGSA